MVLNGTGTGSGSQRFRYLRAPMGLCASGDEFCYRTDAALANCAGVDKLVDDVLIQAKGEKQLLERLEAVLKKGREYNITFSRKKMQHGFSVKFGGFMIGTGTENGVMITPDPGLMRAIRDFKEPTCVTELKSFLGMLQQLSHWNPDLSQHVVKMRTLLMKGVDWGFTDEMREEFTVAKMNLTGDQVLSPFDPELETMLITDAARLHGLGFMLVQKNMKGGYNIIRCGSCSLTPTQRNYSTVELEALGVSYAVRKCDFFLRGLGKFTVWSDHRPLVGLWKKQIRDVDNVRLQKIREKMMPYNMAVQWVGGKANHVADALSRQPLFSTMKDWGIVGTGHHETGYRMGILTTTSGMGQEVLQLVH